MKKSAEEVGQLLDYEKLSAIHLLELPKIEKQDITSYVRCPKYEKAINKVNQTMERYQGKVDRCAEAIEESKRNIEAMERKRNSLNPGRGFFVDTSDAQAVAKYNDRLEQTRKMQDKIEYAIEKHNDLIDKHTEAVEEAKEKLEELTLEALSVIDEDVAAILDRLTHIVEKLSGSQNVVDLVAAIDICLIELRIYAMFEELVEDNTARKDCREHIAKANQLFAALCANERVLNYILDLYRRNLSLIQQNLGIHKQVTQLLGSVDQGQITALMGPIHTVLTEKINTNFEYEGVIDPAELDAIVVQINKTIDALNQNIVKANQAVVAADDIAKIGVSTNQQAETLLASMKSNVDTLKNYILSCSHFAVQIIEEAVIDDFYHKDLRSAVIALRQHLAGALGEKNLNYIVKCDEDCFSLKKAHNAIKQANLVRLQDALNKVPEHIKKTTDLIARAESDIRNANEVPKQNADALNAELNTKYILACFPVFGWIPALGILGRVKAFESAFRSTNQIYRDLGNTLLLKNSTMTKVVMIIGAILGLGGMAAFFVMNLGHSIEVNAGVPGAILMFYIITYLGLTSVGKRLRSFLGISAGSEKVEDFKNIDTNETTSAGHGNELTKNISVTTSPTGLNISTGLAEVENLNDIDTNEATSAGHDNELTKNIPITTNLAFCNNSTGLAEVKNSKNIDINEATSAGHDNELTKDIPITTSLAFCNNSTGFAEVKNSKNIDTNETISAGHGNELTKDISVTNSPVSVTKKARKKLFIPLLIVIVVVVAGAAYFLLTSTKWPGKPKELLPIGNQFTVRIERKIDAMRDSAYSKETYKEINSLINNYHSDQLFSNESSVDNDKWKNILTRKLFDIYVVKFVGYAQSAFKRPEWKVEDLNFIRDEYSEMKKVEITDNSGMVFLLQPGSSVDNLLKEIQEIRRAYENINNFINGCANFSQSGGSFPIADIKNKITMANEYKNKTFKLENETFPLCGRTRKRLEEVPQILFNKHVAFLNSKIAGSLGKYDGFSSQAEYQGAEWTTVKNEIDKLDRTVYGVDSATFTRQYTELKEKWNAEIPRSTNYFEYHDKIIKYINGDMLNKDTLRIYKDVNKYGTTKKLAASINLCLEIWDLNGLNGKTYKNLLEKVSADENIKYSKLKNILNQLRDVTTYNPLPKTLTLN